MEGQRDQVACSRSHSLCTVEPGTDPRLLEPNFLAMYVSVTYSRDGSV